MALTPGENNNDSYHTSRQNNIYIYIYIYILHIIPLDWALYESKEKGFDPIESRWRRNAKGTRYINHTTMIS